MSEVFSKLTDICGPARVSDKLADRICYTRDCGMFSCTIGGSVAYNAVPHGLFEYGMTGQHVIGLEVLLPDGTILNTGSGVNEAAGHLHFERYANGPDVIGLFIGSYGVLGVITKVYFRIRRLPAAERFAFYGFDTCEQAVDAAKGIQMQDVVSHLVSLFGGPKPTGYEQHDAFLHMIVRDSEPAAQERLRVAQAVCEALGGCPLDSEATRLYWTGHMYSWLRNTPPAHYYGNRCGQRLDFSTVGQASKCPAFEGGLFESYAARGKFNIARALVDGVLDYDQEIAKRIFGCTECRACAQDCLKYLDTTAMFTVLKEDLARLGLASENLNQGFHGPNGLDESHNVYKAPHGERLSWLSDRSRANRLADTAFFVGCTSAYVRQNMAVDTASTLERLGVDYTLLADEWCCGHPYIVAGDLDRARLALEHAIAQYRDLGVRRLVLSRPGCLKTFSHDAPQVLGRPLPFEPLHVLEVIARLAEQGDICFRLMDPKITVTYHDSCTLGRWLGIYDAPRTLLRRIPGVAVKEMPRHRETAYCCGAGGLIRYDYDQIADRAGRERFREAESTGADVLLTSCPACLIQFQQTRSRVRSRLRVMDITALIWKQLVLPGEA